MGEWHTGSDIRSEWHLVEIGGIAQVVGGSTPSTKDPTNFGGDIPWITPKDLSGPHDRYVTGGKRNLTRKGLASCSAKLVPPGTVLLTTRAPVGYVAIAGNQIATNQGFRNLILRDGVSPGFVYYWLKANTEELLRHASGSTFTELSGSSLKQIHMLLPEESEQRAIAHILGTLDDKIELNRRMNETLEEMARAIFKSWFVDFDPVRAKMDGRWRRGESLPGMPAEMYDLFPSRLVDSELGEIPEGWEVKSLGDVVITVRGRSYRSAELAESDTALVTLKSFARSGGYRPDGLKSYIGNYKPEQIIEPGEVIIACTDVTQAAEVIGHPAMVQPTTKYDLLVASLDVLIIRPKCEGIRREFLYFLCSTEAFINYTAAYATGTTVLHLDKNAVPSFRLALPTQQLVCLYSKQVGPILEHILINALENENLVVLRDTLLPKLISGELRVGDAEKFMESVV